MTWQTDVFVCYARPAAAAGAFDLTTWSAKLLATLEECINPNSFDDIPKVRFYRDPSAGETGALVDPAKQAALLLVLLSPELIADADRLAEIELFREQALSEGRTVEHTVIATIAATPIEVNRHPAIDWLLGDGTRSNGAEGFTAADGTPLEADRAGPGQPFVALLPAIQSLAGDIRRRLGGLKVLPPLPPPPPTPEPDQDPKTVSAASEPVVVEVTGGGGALIYLQSATGAKWDDTSDALNGLVRVNPARWPPPSGLKAKRKRDEDRREFLSSCQGLVLIRGDAAELTDLLVTEAQNDRTLLEDADLKSPSWVLVDWVEDAGPDLQSWVLLPRVTTGEADWPTRVRKELGL